MNALRSLTVANIRSFVRDRAAIFWTIAFPVVFVLLFGSIFSGRGPTEFTLGWVDEDGTPGSAGLRQAFEGTRLFSITDGEREPTLERMREGDFDAVVVVPAGTGERVQPGVAATPGAPLEIPVYTDASRQTTSTTIQQIVGQVLGGVNQALSGRPPVLALRSEPLETEDITPAAYFVPSILAMALMQLGIFSAVPLVAQREKLILKRLGATPLRRAALVGSNVLMRLLVAVVQTVMIVGIGALAFGVTVVGNPLVVAGLIALGALTFISIGFVIASYARTEEAATALTSIVQFPLMFLSGIFFPIEFMPDILRPVAAALPLTYLGDALRQEMVGGSAFVPIPVDVLVLGAWLVGSFLISARFFRWQ